MKFSDFPPSPLRKAVTLNDRSIVEKINDPSVKWIVYLYVIPHYPHEMYYVGLSSNDIDVRLDYWYGHNKELTDAIRDAGGMKNVGVFILCETPNFTSLA